MKALKILGILVSLILAIAFPSWAGSDYTVYVNPPSGGDDTAVLQAALDDCMTNHPTGCTIQLSAGTYRSTQLFGEDFHGSLKGMGMDATIIQALAPLEVTAGPLENGLFDLNPPSRTNKYPYLVIFMAGDITVSDMTFRVTDPDPVMPWYAIEVSAYVTNLEGLVGVIGTSANLLVKRVGFEGGAGPTPGSLNLDEGPFYLGLSGAQPLTGRFEVVSSRIRNSMDSFQATTVRNGQITIGGSPSEGNVVEDGQSGCVFADLDHSVVEYSYNKVTVSNSSWDGIALLQGFTWIPAEPSQFLIEHDTFKVTGDSVIAGVWAVDFGPYFESRKTADFVISDNTIEINGTAENPAWAGIDGVFAVDAVISNNRISGGNAVIGIAMEGSSKCMLLGNNLQGLQPLYAPVALLTTDWGAGPIQTSYCTVVGGNNKVNVYDEGTKNVLVGVSNMQGNPPGPAVKAAMQRKHDMLKSLLRP